MIRFAVARACASIVRHGLHAAGGDDGGDGGGDGSGEGGEGEGEGEGEEMRPFSSRSQRSLIEQAFAGATEEEAIL
jgi:hypothetical protein